MHIKDLRVIDRELSDIVLVDNAAYSYIHQIDNGIPILPFFHGNTDFELKALQTYIESMMLVKDVRTVNRKTFKLYLYKNYYYELDKLVEELYLA
jgi:CTD small phosphatase-like protein 2